MKLALSMSISWTLNYSFMGCREVCVSYCCLTARSSRIWISPSAGPFLSGVWMFSPCLWRFSPVVLACSQRLRLICISKLPIGVNDCLSETSNGLSRVYNISSCDSWHRSKLEVEENGKRTFFSISTFGLNDKIPCNLKKILRLSLSFSVRIWQVSISSSPILWSNLRLTSLLLFSNVLWCK